MIIRKVILFMWLLLVFTQVKTQSVLEANGPGNTYELINSILAPGYTAVESPDQCTSHPSFGRHVTEVFDATLNQFVFEFYMHVPTSFPVTANTADNDRCLNFDRQRVEIKTYESSPDSLKGTVGETVTYKWKFRLPAGFQPSPNFTHIHQVKAVGGDDDDPIFTLTARAGTSSNSLQLIFVDASVNAANTLLSVNLNSFLGTWVEVTEQIKVGANGTYSINIKRVSDGAVLLNYSNSNILTIRPDNNFIRPKWGIYRSLLNPSYLRDDSIRIASISIFEGLPPAAPTNLSATTASATQVNLSWTDNSTNERSFVVERSLNGVSGWTTIYTAGINITSFSDIGLSPSTTYYYRVRADNPVGSSAYSAVVSAKTFQALPALLQYFSAAQINQKVQISWGTLNEINVAGFIIEWSVDGVNFSAIANIQPKHSLNNVIVNNYLFLHKTDKAQNYYRIKILDNDGSYQYSTVKSISLKSNNEIVVYPNPVKNYLTIDISKTSFKNVDIQLNDITGRQVLSSKVNNLIGTLQLNNIAEGVYSIQLQNNGTVIQRKNIIISKK